MRRADLSATSLLEESEALEDRSGELSSPQRVKQQRPSVDAEASYSDTAPVDATVEEDAFAWLANQLSWERRLDELRTMAGLAVAGGGALVTDGGGSGQVDSGTIRTA
jgi:hypothetical protein